MPDPTEPGPGILAGKRPVLELLRAGRPADKILILKGARMTGALGEIRRRAEAAGLVVRMVPRTELDRQATGLNHQGVVAVTERFRYKPLADVLARRSGSLLFLDGVTDPQNLGSLLRSADGAGFNAVVIPARRAAGVTAAVRRVAAGAAEVVPVCKVTNLSRSLDEAREAGFWTLGLDAAAPEDIWTSNLAEPPVALVLGSEGRGLSRVVAEHCDGTVRIPTSGRLESLNVAVAGAVAMFEIARRARASSTL